MDPDDGDPAPSQTGSGAAESSAVRPPAETRQQPSRRAAIAGRDDGLFENFQFGDTARRPPDATYGMPSLPLPKEQL